MHLRRGGKRFPYTLDISGIIRLNPDHVRQGTPAFFPILIDYSPRVFVESGLTPDLVTGFNFAPELNYDTSGGFAATAFSMHSIFKPRASLADIGYLYAFHGAPEFHAADGTTSSIAHLYGFSANPYLKRTGSGVASATELYGYETWPDVLGAFDPDITSAGTVARLGHYHGTEPRVSGTTITAQYVFDGGASLTVGTKRATFYSAQTAGVGFWTMLGEGTAKSSHKGQFRLGDNTEPTELLEVLGNVLIDNAGTAGELRLREPSGGGPEYTSFKSPALGAPVNYTLPPDDGDVAEQLQSNGAGILTWEPAGGAASGDITAVGDCTINDCFIDGVSAGTELVHEGATVNLDETRLAFTGDPSADFTVTIPNETGTVCTTGAVCTGYQAGPLSGDVVTSGAAATIQANAVALPADTTGNYVSSATASQGLTVTGTEDASVGLQDCAANEILKRNAGDTAWTCQADGGSGAPTTAQYLVDATDPTLTAEHVLQVGPGLTITRGVTDGGNTTISLHNNTKRIMVAQPETSLTGTAPAACSGGAPYLLFSDGHSALASGIPSGGSRCNVSYSDGTYVRFINGSGATLSGVDHYIASTNFITRSDHNPIFIATVRTGPSLATYRAWVGLTSSSNTTNTGLIADSDNPTAAGDYAMFRYSTTPDGSDWRTCTRDGTTQNCMAQAAGMTIAASTTYVLKIDFTGSDVLFYINDVLVRTHTTNEPRSDQPLRWYFGVTTTTAANLRQLDFRRIYVATE
jgi:hypothetical protein